MTFRPYVQGMWRQPLNIRRQNIQSGKIIMKLYCIYKYVCHYIYYITNNFKTKSECDLCIISYKLIFIIYLTYTRWWLYRYSNMNIILQDNLYIICLSHSIICYLCTWWFCTTSIHSTASKNFANNENIILHFLMTLTLKTVFMKAWHLVLLWLQSFHCWLVLVCFKKLVSIGQSLQTSKMPKIHISLNTAKYQWYVWSI